MPPKERTKPVVGMGATYYVGSDRYGCTVLKVSKTGYKVVLSRDEARVSRLSASGDRIDGRLFTQTERTITVYRGQNGQYQPHETGGCRYGLVTFGRRRQSLDRSF
jgi:hypothetical protein